MVLEEGLDTSELPETLKEDFDQLNRLEGQYRVTSILMEAIDLEDKSPRKGPQCGFCNVKEEAEKMKPVVKHYKPMTTLSKVEVGSAMYKKGIRWTECMETFGRTDLTYMVLDHITIVFMIILIVFPIALVMIIFARCSGTRSTRTPRVQRA